MKRAHRSCASLVSLCRRVTVSLCDGTSQRLTVEYHLNQCQAIFGIPNMAPTVDAINR
jgi:hypothetical protein